MKIRSQGLLALLTALLLVPMAGFAQTPEIDPPPAFIFTPSDPSQTYFSIEAEPGSTTELTVVIGVDASKPTASVTFAGDAYTLTNGGFGVNEIDDPVSEPTTWLDYPTENLELEPGSLIERTFTVSVPESTAPGQYITGLIVQTANPIPVGESTMLQQTLRRAIAVLITVPGEVRAEFSVDAASVRQQPTTSTLVMQVHNPGNVLVKPAGEVVLSEADGAEIVRAPVLMNSVYAGMQTTLEVPIPARLAPGNYVVQVSLTDEATGASTGDLRFDVTVDEEEDATPNPVSVSSFTTEPLTNDAGEVQLVQVAAAIENAGSAVPAVRLTLMVTLNGELVEQFVINPALALPNGITDIEARYLPIDGWQSGTYAFALLLEAVDQGTGQSTRLGLIESETTVQVP